MKKMSVAAGAPAANGALSGPRNSIARNTRSFLVMMAPLSVRIFQF
jgi:hypothetical protein